MSQNLRATAARIETLVQEFAALADPHLRESAEEIVQLLMQLYGAALAKVVEAALATADENAGGREEFFRRLTDDPLVTSLLVLHELHPQDTRSRIGAALERVRPYLASHGGNVVLVTLEQDSVRLRMEGNCDGCPSSSITMKLAIEKAIQEAAPEVARIEVEQASRSTPTIPATIPLESQTGAQWMTLDPLPDFNGRNLAAIELKGTKFILCRAGDTLYAYQHRCPACGASLEQGALRDAILSCPACQRQYDVRRAGRCFDDDGYHLAPLPLLAEDEMVRISIPA